MRSCDGASDVRVVHARGVGNEIGVLLLAWLLAERAEGPQTEWHGVHVDRHQEVEVRETLERTCTLSADQRHVKNVVEKEGTGVCRIADVTASSGLVGRRVC